jgi:hypothetical protein
MYLWRNCIILWSMVGNLSVTVKYQREVRLHNKIWGNVWPTADALTQLLNWPSILTFLSSVVILQLFFASLPLLHLRFSSIMPSEGSIINSKIRENKTTQVKGQYTLISDVSVTCQCRISAVRAVSGTETSSHVFWIGSITHTSGALNGRYWCGTDTSLISVNRP